MKHLMKKPPSSFESETLAFSPAKRQITHAMGLDQGLQEIPLRQSVGGGHSLTNVPLGSITGKTFSDRFFTLIVVSSPSSDTGSVRPLMLKWPGTC